MARPKGPYKVMVWYNRRLVEVVRKKRKEAAIQIAFKFIDVFRTLQGKGLACDWRVRVTDVLAENDETLILDLADHDDVLGLEEVRRRVSNPPMEVRA